MNEKESLCCCEYIDRDNERNHILGCCCNCVDFDQAADRLDSLENGNAFLITFPYYFSAYFGVSQCPRYRRATCCWLCRIVSGHHGLGEPRKSPQLMLFPLLSFRQCCILLLSVPTAQWQSSSPCWPFSLTCTFTWDAPRPGDRMRNKVQNLPKKYWFFSLKHFVGRSSFSCGPFGLFSSCGFSSSPQFPCLNSYPRRMWPSYFFYQFRFSSSTK